VRAFALILAAVALAASACSSGSDSSAEEQPGPAQDTTPAESAAHFTRAQLPQIALRPSDAPAGMHYVKESSGRQSLEDAGFVLPSQTKQLQKFKLRGIYDATYDAENTDLRLASRVWLFADADGAKRWLEKTQRDAEQFAFEPLEAPRLGQESWGGYGNLAAQIVTYAFREGNVVVVTSYSTQTEEISQQAALDAAAKAAERLDEA
jgi:hypothetical protein